MSNSFFQALGNIPLAPIATGLGAYLGQKQGQVAANKFGKAAVPAAAVTPGGSTFFEQGPAGSPGIFRATLSDTQQKLADQALGMSTSQADEFGTRDFAGLENEIFSRMQEITSTDRQRAEESLRDRLFGQGRLGTEAGARELGEQQRGFEQARNQASLDAMQFASQERQSVFDRASSANTLAQGALKGWMPAGDVAIKAGNFNSAAAKNQFDQDVRASNSIATLLGTVGNALGPQVAQAVKSVVTQPGVTLKNAIDWVTGGGTPSTTIPGVIPGGQGGPSFGGGSANAGIPTTNMYGITTTNPATAGSVTQLLTPPTAPPGILNPYVPPPMANPAVTSAQSGFSAGSPFSSAYNSLFGGGGQALGWGSGAGSLGSTIGTTAFKASLAGTPAPAFAAPGLAGVLGPAALGFAFVMGAKALDPTKTKTPDKHAGDAKKQQDIGLAIAQQNPSMVYGGRSGGGPLMDPSNKPLTNALHSAIRAIGDAKFDPPMMQKVQEILGPELFQLAQGFATSPMYGHGKSDVTGRPILTQGGQAFSGTPQATRALFGAPALTGPGSATLSAERLRQIDIRGGGGVA